MGMKRTNSELKKYFTLVESKRMTNKIAAFSCGYTPEHFTRLRKKFKTEGDKMFIHAHSGKPAYNAIPPEVRAFVVQKYIEEFDENSNPINFQYHTDNLNEIYDLDISYKSVYNILTDAGIKSPEVHKVKRESVKRIRFKRKHEGELLQLDATLYQWFKWCGDNTYYALHGSLDDATSGFTGLYMCENECRYGYIEVRRQTIKKHGLELEDYTDKAAIFSHNNKEKTNLTIDEQLKGINIKPTQWERMNGQLHIDLTLANSPQSKGKIERAWKTIQGRLPAMLRRYNIKTVESANAFLQTTFIQYYNEHFAKEPIEKTPVWRTAPDSFTLQNILCVKESRRVMKNGCISFLGVTFKVQGIEHYGVNGELCINENGLWYLLNSKRYKVEIKDEFCNLSETAPQVLQNIIYKTMFAKCKEHCA